MVLSFPLNGRLGWIGRLKKAVKERTELAGPIDMFQLWKVEMDLRSQKQILEDIKSQDLGEPLEGFIYLTEVFSVFIPKNKVPIIVQSPERESLSVLILPHS